MMKKIKISLKKRQQRAGSKTSKKLMMDSSRRRRRRRRRRRSITQLPHCVGTTFYWLLLRSTSHYKLHVSKNLLCWILSALCFSKPWQRSSHYWELFASPSTTHSSCKSPLPYQYCSILFVNVFCFPLFINLSIFAAI